MIGLAMMLAATQAAGGYPSRQFISGNRLYEICNSASGPDLVECLAYIEGVSDMIATTEAVLSKRMVCVSSQVTVGQEKDVALLYMKNHPATRDTNAAALVFLALTEAFPCPKT